jgi:hypothetical protein
MGGEAAWMLSGDGCVLDPGDSLRALERRLGVRPEHRPRPPARPWWRLSSQSPDDRPALWRELEPEEGPW